MSKVSVIMPCYNASAYLREAIESVRTQSYKDWELLIIDDGSTDDSREIATEYAIKDKRIQLIEQPNSGACRARNNGIEHAKGEYVKFLDADDVLEQECLTEQVKQIGVLTERQIPFGDYYHIDMGGRILSRVVFINYQDALLKDQVAFFFHCWHILISAPLHRTTLLREIGGFDESLKRGQESNLHFRLALADVEFVYRPCMTFRYREHNASSRISKKYQEGTEGRYEYRIQSAHIYERLLIEKYRKVPQEYMYFFANEWFIYAREMFAKRAEKDGLLYLNKAKHYGFQNRFQRFYFTLGAIIGYVPLESIFQLRLKIRHKQ